MYQIIFLLLLCVAISLILSIVALIYLFLINKEITNITKKVSTLAPKEGLGEIVIKTSNKALEDLMKGVNIFIERQHKVNNPTRKPEQQAEDQLNQRRSPRSALQFAIVNLTKQVSQMLALYHKSFEDSKITSTINVPYIERLIRVDEGTLDIILKNLMGCILKYSEGDFELNLLEDEGFIVLEIKNHSPSLSEQDLESILDGTYSKSKDGSSKMIKGQGLKVTVDLVEMMDGSMEATITDGQLVIVLGWLKHELKQPKEI